MEKRINRRYELLKPIVPMRSGILYSGNDLSLNREIIIFVVESRGEKHKQAYLQLLQQVAMFNDSRFLHILDVGIENQRIFAALKTFAGKPLIQGLKHHSFSTREIIAMVFELGKGLQDAMEHGISGFSVLSSNVWIGDDGQLQMINYWEKGEPAERGVQGLAGLLYQLMTRSETLPDSLQAAEHSLRSALKDMPESYREMFMMTWRRAWNGQNTLSSFILSLQNAAQEPWTKETQPMEESFPNEYEEPDDMEEDEEQEPRQRGFLWRASAKLMIGAAVAGFSILFLIFLFGLGGPDKQDPTIAGQSNQRDAALNTSPAPTESEPEPEHEREKSTQTEDEQETSAEPPEAAQEPPSSDGPVFVPNLIGLTKQQAEKQALASGLRYQFFIEPNESPAETVFKQDLEPGRKVNKGERITFWVSRGN
ncbi:Stk1 family PASTA domain-containing Ser/Thr kinase [Paenibacillus naphthalenovorans]|uniref:PASTA domain-containing protein n=1 Tax=Paenibacillus naphthalenovorans TaxID=162209 RepID=A0A0U2W3P3_9BACL|nr:Stk1 family PASTA domain-containing Ser/Thr kinase [Paenibacillus naphthalenovorans]ALS22013.1 PASTA domain-containing protein [Paenibacillus naphthalenovorans]